MSFRLAILFLCFLFIFACKQQTPDSTTRTDELDILPEDTTQIAISDTLLAIYETKTLTYIHIDREVTVRELFNFLDILIAQYDTLVDYSLTEHMLVHTNPWIIDTLESFDYYKRMEKGEFIYDHNEMIIFRENDSIVLPCDSTAAAIETYLTGILIDVNIPEFKLRIYVYDSLLYTFPVRVGKNERKHLAMAGREVNLRTPVGTGEIVRIAKYPAFINPVTGRRYHSTKRDDGKYTMMPNIPWLEPEISRQRHGSLIHPTTNPETLGKASSNGCIGTPEGAAWRIYYYAPLGTKVNFRYDLLIENELGDTIRLKDIYQRQSALLNQFRAELATLNRNITGLH